MRLTEVIRHCDESPDPMVRYLVEIVEGLAEVMSEQGQSDLEDFVETLRNNLHDLHREVDNLTQDLEEKDTEVEDLTREVKALKYDLSRDCQNRMTEDLKAQVYDSRTEIRELKQEIARLNTSHATLTKRHNELQDKYNTWTAIAT